MPTRKIGEVVIAQFCFYGLVTSGPKDLGNDNSVFSKEGEKNRSMKQFQGLILVFVLP